MKKKRHTVEQIVRILREADSGLRNEEVCLRHNISQQTFYRWKRKYEGMDLREAQRLRDLKKENGELKKLLPNSSSRRRLLRLRWKKTSKPRAAAQHGREGSTGFVLFQASCLPMAGHQQVHLTLSTQASPQKEAASRSWDRPHVSKTSNLGLQKDRSQASRFGTQGE